MAGRKPYHHGDLREALLAATETVLKKQGVAGLSMREVARVAGVTHGAPAHHFGNKAGLLTAFAAQGSARMTDTILKEAQRRDPGNPRSFFEAVGHGYVAFARAHPEQYEVMFRQDMLNLKDPAYRKMSDATWSMLADTVRRCADAGFLPSADVETVTALSWALAHGLSEFAISGRFRQRFPAASVDKTLGRLIDFYVGATMPVSDAPKP